MKVTSNGITPNVKERVLMDSAALTGAATGTVIWTTGEIATQIPGGKSLSFETPALSPSGTVSLQFKYGLWNSPDVTLSVSLNGVTLGTVNAMHGYIAPGPQYVSWWPIDLTGSGNTIQVTASAGSGEAVVGSLSIING